VHVVDFVEGAGFGGSLEIFEGRLENGSGDPWSKPGGSVAPRRCLVSTSSMQSYFSSTRTW